MPSKTTKTSTIVKLLRRPQGTRIKQRGAATGWRAHRVLVPLNRRPTHGHEAGRDQGKDRITRSPIVRDG